MLGQIAEQLKRGASQLFKVVTAATTLEVYEQVVHVTMAAAAYASLRIRADHPTISPGSRAVCCAFPSPFRQLPGQ